MINGQIPTLNQLGLTTLYGSIWWNGATYPIFVPNINTNVYDGSKHIKWLNHFKPSKVILEISVRNNFIV